MEFDRILIIATRQIGDVLCTTPLIRRTRELWPQSIIDVLGYEKTMGMLKGNSDINTVIESPERPSWIEYKKIIARIFRQYDLAIVTQPSDRAHIYGLLAAPKRVGIVPNRKTHSWWKRLLSIHTIELDYWEQHVVVERLRLLDKFLTEADVAAPLNISITPPSAEPLPSDLRNFLTAGPTAVIHATPMWRFKRWPIQNWAELISALLKSGRRVVLTGSSSQQDRELNAQILTLVARDFPNTPLSELKDCAGQLSLGQTTALLELAQLYIGVDTSITHLAAACGTRTIALYGATTPTNFGPWPKNADVLPSKKSLWRLLGEETLLGARIQNRNNVTIIQGPGRCVPCRKAGCMDRFESHSDCLNHLSPSVIADVLSHETPVA